MRAWSKQALGVIGLLVFATSVIGCRKARARRDDQGESTEATKEAAKEAPDGVTDETVRLSQVASFTGAQAGLGTESYRGAMAYFAEVNARGGVHGRKIEIVPVDDKYTSEGGEAATEKAINDDRPFVFFGASGTEPSSGIVKTLKKYEAKKFVLWGSTSGAEVLRAPEFAPFAFNIRGSLKSSGKDVVEAFASAGFKKIGVVAQDDGFGKSAATAAKKAIEDKGLTMVLEMPIPKSAKPETSDAKDIVAKMKAAGAEAVVLAATYNPSTVFVRDARDSGWNVAAATMATPDTMLRQLTAIEKKTGKRMTNALLGCTNAPPVSATDLPAVREYRDLTDKRKADLPAQIADPNYRPLRYSTNALESFIGARAIVEAMERAGKNLTRDSLRKAAESMIGWDPGVGQKLTWGQGDNQGFDSVWLPGIKNDEFVLVTDMKKYLTDKPEPVLLAKDDKDAKDAKPGEKGTATPPPAAANAKTAPGKK